MPDTRIMPDQRVDPVLPMAREALLSWIRDAGSEGRVFLQVHLLALPDDRFRLRQVADAAAPARDLECSADPYEARRIAQTTPDGAHRPLKTAPNLRTGWTLEPLDGAGLWTALDYIYPASAVHWYMALQGELNAIPWRETAARQSGMYSAVRLLTEPAVRAAVHACCADAVCLRSVAWGYSEADTTPILHEEETSDAGATVPCPEACSLFISFAREILTVERSPRVDFAASATIRQRDLEQIRTLVRAGASGTKPAAREGEFSDPLNRRRLRYLDVRLSESAGGDGPE